MLPVTTLTWSLAVTSGTIGIPFYSSRRHVTSDEFERQYQRTLTPHYSDNC